MLMILLALVCVSLLIAVGYWIVHQSIEATKLELGLQGQVYNVAASGVTETLSWFRSRKQQPVKRFNPKTPTAIAFGEEGIIRNFPVSDSARIWGRYVVSPANVEDITDRRSRGKKGDGLVWRIKAQGYLYINRDPAMPFNKKPNEIVHRFMLATEFQRLNLNPPAASAILTQRADRVEVLQGGRVRGFNGAAITYRQGTGKPTVVAPFDVSSSRSNRFNPAPEASYALDVRSIFGVTWDELRELSDIVVDNTALLPPELPKMGIVLVAGKAVFDHKRPLQGGGVLLVDGDLSVAPNSNSSFAGLIYCRGNFTMDAPALVSGSVIALGDVRLQGFGDFAEVQFDDDLLTFMKQRLGQYRQTKPLIQVKR